MELYDHQFKALGRLHNGSILRGGVGSGKSRTALAYFYIKECQGGLEINGSGEFREMKTPKDLYIITTARKRDTLDWIEEGIPFSISSNKDTNPSNINMIVDSWNNVAKYTAVKDAFFIFDEQRLVGSGAWVKAFLKIVKANHWILLTATPGDTWTDYIPVFIANGFYKNRGEFLRKHVVYNRYSKYPKIDRYLECDILVKHRNDIVVDMRFSRKTKRHQETVNVAYDKTSYTQAVKYRWDIYKDEPLRDASALCYQLRRIVNSDRSRLKAIGDIYEAHPRLIVFYNFDYELEMLRDYCGSKHILMAEWNGHKHEPIPDSNSWIYLVQYTAGAEAWNCITTNAIAFYSQNYSYKIMEQASGRIDRLNTPYSDLYYYKLISGAGIDTSIQRALSSKKNFNESDFSKEVNIE